MVTPDEYRKLVSMARGMCALYRLTCEAHDLAHDTIIVCEDKVEQFDPTRGAKLQWMKSRMRKLALERGGTEVVRDLKRDEVAPSRYERDGDMLHKLDEVLSGLCERDRAVLRCRYIDGLTVQQTAEVLGLTRDQVRVTKRRVDRLAVQRG